MFRQEHMRLEAEVAEQTVEASRLIEDELFMLPNLSGTDAVEREDVFGRLQRAFRFWQRHTVTEDIYQTVMLFCFDGERPEVFGWNEEGFSSLSSDLLRTLPEEVLLGIQKTRLDHSFSYVSETQEAETAVSYVISSVSDKSRDFVLVCIIDEDVFATKVIPALAQKTFSDAAYMYRIVTVPSGTVLYSSNAADGAEPEVDEDLLFSEPDFSYYLFSRIESNDDTGLYTKIQKKWTIPAGDVPEESETMFSVLRSHVFKTSGEVPDEYYTSPEDNKDHIVVEVVHRNGSIVQAAFKTTMINTVSSFILVLVLGAGIIVLAASNGRNRKLIMKQKEFLATVTHELKTPVSVISAISQNLADGVVTDPDRVREYGRLLHGETVRLKASVEDCLSYANITQTATLHLEEFSLSSLVREMIEADRGLFANAGFTVETDMQPDELIYYGDRKAASILIQNMMSNAVKHAADGKYLKVTVCRQADGVHLLFRDKGKGIPKADRKRIFEAFERGSAAVAGQIDGSGIGLNLVKRIAEKHKGYVRINWTGASGTEFDVCLGLLQAP